MGWVNTELVVTCGDDQKLQFWNTANYHEPVRTVQLPIDAFPTSMHYQTSALASLNNEPGAFSNLKLDSQSNNQIALGATNGHFYLFPINWTGAKFEKDLEAHRGSIIAIKWSNDNSTLATGGEDGLIKIWSRVGMLRSTIVASSLPIYGLSWSPDSNNLSYVNSQNIVIKSLSPQSKTIEWIAHEGIIVSINWSTINNFILSAGEDGRVKMWDNTGRLLFASSQHTSALTSVLWSPDGEHFAVSTFNSLKLHDASGICLSVEKLSTEGIHTLSWSADSNQICCGCSNGQVLFGYVVERSLESNAWNVTNSSRRTVRVNNAISDFNELLEFRDSVMRMSLSYDYLVIVTTSQCFIYHTANWSTPHHFDVKNLNIMMVKQSQKQFILLTPSSVNVYSYDGRFLKTLKLLNVRIDSIRPNVTSLNNYTFAYRESVNQQTVHFVDIETVKTSTNKERQPNSYSHLIEVTALQLSNEDKQNNQICAILDKNSDLYLVLVNNSQNTNLKVFKFNSVVKDFRWHQEFNILVSLQETKTLSLWLYPFTVFIDSSLLQDVMLTIINGDITANSRIMEFSRDQIKIQRFDQVKINISVNAFIILLHKHRSNNKWNEAIRICNFLDKSISEVETIDVNIRNALWATLSVMTLEAKEFQTAEIAYAAINKLDKVLYLNRIKSLPHQDAVTAELEILCGNLKGAEQFLIQKGFVLKVILLNLELHQWSKALKLAEDKNVKFNGIVVKSFRQNNNFNDDDDETDKFDENFKVDLIHLVLACRQHYLKSRNKQETIKEFKSLYNEVNF